MLLENNVF